MTRLHSDIVIAQVGRQLPLSLAGFRLGATSANGRSGCAAASPGSLSSPSSSSGISISSSVAVSYCGAVGVGFR